MKTSASLGVGQEGMHRRHLRDVLRMTYEQGAVSRADLTLGTSLNRSTTASLVAELVELGLVVQSPPPTPTGVGRPSPVVRPHPDVVCVAVNPEVDAVTTAVVGLDGCELQRVVRPQRRTPSARTVASTVASTLDELHDVLAGRRVVGLGVAVPGIVSRGEGIVRLAPHLGWHDEPLAERLAAATGLVVSAANDAHLGVRAEQLFGSARGQSDVVYVNGGASGIGGGVVVGGRVLSGRSGYAGEIGHTRVVEGGRRCHCGSRGCLETEVSQARLVAAAEADGAPRRRRGSSVTDHLARLLAEPSPSLDDEADRQLAHLAVALRNVVAVVNPGLLVLGGFLGVLRDARPARLEQLLAAECLPVLRDDVEIVTASLGSAILLRGAADLAFTDLLADPGRP